MKYQSVRVLLQFLDKCRAATLYSSIGIDVRHRQANSVKYPLRNVRKYQFASDLISEEGLMRTRPIILATLVALVCFTSAPAQTLDSILQQKPAHLSLSGPRLGITLVTGKDADELRSKADAGPIVSQFGWQFEQQFLSTKEGLAGLTEWVFLVGGAEQGTLLPSLSWLVGLRTAGGTEFGLGPNISLSGPALVLAAGITQQSASLNFPINLAVVIAKGGPRIALLVGFNKRD
jgi:hypothetical protein